MTLIFVGGAIGSTLGSLTYFNGGWWLTVAVGVCITVVASLLFATEYRRAAA